MLDRLKPRPGARRPRKRVGRGPGSGYRVGIGRRFDAYASTRRAVEVCGEWPSSAMAGRTVAIKPNLVLPLPAETGVTTDPQVVRALVDMAIDFFLGR